MKTRPLVALAAVAVLLAGCATENKYEREAQKITQAVQKNDMSSVKDDLSPSIKLNRVQVANWSDELSAQGKIKSVKEVTPCDKAGFHCLDVKFDKSTYHEWLQMDDQNKVVNWHFHAANAG
ncbi:MAG TPA: hypothetical protein VFN49_05080 [Candidatus Aquilonibacter sp.]|nr:hypothetical protein [Candidatus Aquilonibacter sp.]